jgi:hypothetical protein
LIHTLKTIIAAMAKEQDNWDKSAEGGEETKYIDAGGGGICKAT